LGGRNRKIKVQGQPRQKVSKTLHNKTSQAWWYMAVTPATQKVAIRGYQPETSPGKSGTLSEK
jgi:hypothetical protein